MQTRTASVRDREEKGDAAQKRGAAQKGNNELRPLLFAQKGNNELRPLLFAFYFGSIVLVQRAR